MSVWLPKSAPAIKEKYTKTQLLSEIAENTGLSKRQVANVLDELTVLIERHIKKVVAVSLVCQACSKL